MVGDIVMKNAAISLHFGRRWCVDVITSLLTGLMQINTGGARPWAKICKLRVNNSDMQQIMRNGIKVMVGNGLETFFCEDVWLGDTYLMERLPRLYSMLHKRIP